MLEQILSQTDTAIYFWMGASATALLMLRIFLMMIFGIDGGGDFDGDVGANVDLDHDSGAGFQLFSTFSILSFLMGAGWMGLACRSEWGLGQAASAFSAAGFGLFLMFLSAGIMYQMRKLNAAGHYDVRNAVGKIGRVYMAIPARGQGTGKIQITFDGRQTVLDAKSAGEAIDSFASVRVTELEGHDTAIVEPV
jgi:hypothetical protein